uniref:Uncharacterized protein n=1 Tax=Rhizophora mucronata TaxID=61149 RepID=A0A2P2KSC7_RHIMU
MVTLMLFWSLFWSLKFLE